jgi:DNA-binding helix-hairpin-helix protein with protein kinase domain
MPPPASAPLPQADVLAPPKPAPKSATAQSQQVGFIVLGLLLILVAVAFGVGLWFLPREIALDQLTQAERDAILNPVYQSIYTTQTEDIEAYMATIHPDSALYDSTRQLATQLFEQYDVSVEGRDIAIVKVTQYGAEVAFTLITRKIRGPEFADNIISGVFILKQDGDVWKIENQRITATEFIK